LSLFFGSAFGSPWLFEPPWPSFGSPPFLPLLSEPSDGLPDFGSPPPFIGSFLSPSGFFSVPLGSPVSSFFSPLPASLLAPSPLGEPCGSPAFFGSPGAPILLARLSVLLARF